MAILVAQMAPDIIRLVGRWCNDNILHYLHTTANSFMDSLVTPLLCITLWYLRTHVHIYRQEEAERRPSDWTLVKEVGLFMRAISCRLGKRYQFPRRAEQSSVK